VETGMVFFAADHSRGCREWLDASLPWGSRGMECPLVEPTAARGWRGSGERRTSEQGFRGVRNDALMRLTALGGFGRAAHIPSVASAAPGSGGLPPANDSWNRGCAAAGVPAG
jgi:hypothetical protein